uniref:RBR-type E3 ubiquitin transferase n=1 Tax=Kalanchoe fedtschenkoi TaxID=63787 RepID=A0A7N0TK45_KALFE
MESDDEVSYSDDEYEEFDTPDCGDDSAINKQPEWRSLDEDQIRHIQTDTINSISTLFSVPEGAASILLRNFNWDLVKLQDMWFTDQDAVLKSAGLLTGDPETRLLLKRPILGLGGSWCAICLTLRQLSAMDSAACGHLFCTRCWKQYVKTAITDGPRCLTLRCPQPNCAVSLDESLITKLVSKRLKATYTRFLIRNFVECSKTIRWCPSPGCKYAVEFTGLGVQDVTCRCSYRFCWDCLDESHRPADCETAKKWLTKNTSESGNAEWILANSKPCPKCHRSIEKNHGCSHMTCTPPCSHQFCWICLGAWTKHCESSYSCNQYKKTVTLTGQENERRAAKISWHKYNHYYQRWMNNQISGDRAVKNLKEDHVNNMKTLKELYGESDTNVEEFFLAAWKQIIECRRVLKWTYAYGYYMPDDEKRKRTFFEYLQGQAESVLERLHHCAEEELKEFVEDDEERSPVAEFMHYKLKLIELTHTTRKFFDNLVEGMEGGLREVSSKKSKSGSFTN